MTQTLTTDELRQIVASAKTSLEQYLALELLANLEAKPVGYVSASTLNCLKSMQTHEIITAKPEKDAVNERDWDVIPVYTAPPAPAVPDGYCIMPLKLTAANGAKGALSGEFKVSRTVRCHECGGEGCDDCSDAGEFEEEITVPWDTIKDIYRAAVDTCRAAMLAQPVSQGYKLPPHAYRELVNSLRDTAVKYSGTDQLRERLNTTLSQFIEPDHPHTRTAAPDSV